MAPKAKNADPVEEDIVPGPGDELEAEVEDGTSIRFDVVVSGASMLPKELGTKVSILGLCRELRSSPAARATSPQDWEFAKSFFVRRKAQPLYDDLVSKDLRIVLKDSENFKVIGEAVLSLLPLLHNQTEVGGELQLVLTDDYMKMWNVEAGDATEVPKATDVPKSTLSVVVTVSELVGPLEDRSQWTTLNFQLGGVFALPTNLTSLGGPDPSAHPLRYSAKILGEAFGQGILSKPSQARPAPVAAQEPPTGTEAELDLEHWQKEQELYELSVRFPKRSSLTVYRGASFIREFRYMLNSVGGVWLYFTCEEVPSPDPKKPNPPELAAISKSCSGKAWINLSQLLRPKCQSVGPAFAPLVSVTPGNNLALENSRSFVCLRLELSHDTSPPVSLGSKLELPRLLPQREPAPKFPSAADAVTIYKEAVIRSFHEVSSINSSVPKGAIGVQCSVELLKQVGGYEKVKKDLRDAVVQICRERLRKDVAVVPGRPLDGTVRGEFMANTHTYLEKTMIAVIDELRAAATEQLGQEMPRSSEPGGGQPDRGKLDHFSSHARRVNIKENRKRSEEVVEDGVSPVESGQSAVRMALDESVAARRSREALGVNADLGCRFSRLAMEAEMVGNWERAASLMQSRLVLEEFREEPKAWVEYAKLCARSRGRQAAAEEALQQAVKLMAASMPHSEETALEVDLMLASLLLDRGRHEDAIRVFRALHSKDPLDPMLRFFLGIALFLADEGDDAKMFLRSASKPREWFQRLSGSVDDLPSVIQELNLSRDLDPLANAYAPFLEKLLEFGLPQLVFTFLDQTGTLSNTDLTSEFIAVLDAKALAMERDYNGAIARVDGLIVSKEASREVWRLVGDCHWNLQDYDKALQALQQSLSFDARYEDPSFYVRLGHVLMQKKRWKQARDVFLKSIGYGATAEAWNGVAYAEYRSEELQTCYEALCEANFLDDERADVWATLALVHLRFENLENSNHCFRRCLELRPECDELLLELSAEYVRREMLPALAESACRRALVVRDSGQGHAALAEALALAGSMPSALSEAQVAISLFVDSPEQRKAMVDRALKWCEEDPDGVQAVLHANKLADELYAQHESH